jgi:hypothetical protein
MSLTQTQVQFGLNMGATHHDGEDFRLKVNGRWAVLDIETKTYKPKALGKKTLERLDDYLITYDNELKEYLKEIGADESKLDLEEVSAIWVHSKALGKRYINDRLKGV